MYFLEDHEDALDKFLEDKRHFFAGSVVRSVGLFQELDGSVAKSSAAIRASLSCRQFPAILEHGTIDTPSC